MPAILLTLLATACAKSGVPAEAKGLIQAKKYDQGLALLEKAYADNPGNQEVKTELIGASVAYGNELTYKSDLPPREKYSKGLKMYKRALELDPGQKEAMEGKNLIESIYASMGRPVPQ